MINRIHTTALLLVVTTVTWAQQSTHRQHDAHVHGHAAVNIAVSGKDLQLELSSPAMNLLGFGHRAESAQDKKILHDAVAFLRQTGQWIGLDRTTGCQLAHFDIKSEQLEEDEHEKHESEEDHKGHESDEKHGHHESVDKHEDHQSSESQHSDFEIMAEFDCQNAQDITRIDLSGLFNRFAGFDEIEVQWITDQSQSATELNHRQPIIQLNR